MYMASTIDRRAAFGRRWGGGKVSGKQFVMAAMIGTLALLAVVCAVIVVLRPAHLVFAARVIGASDAGGEKRIRINIIANNTSKHARVQYRSMKTEVWIDDKQWVPVDFDDKTSDQFRGDRWWQPPDNSTHLTALVHVLEADEKTNHPPPPAGKLAGDTSATAGGTSPSPASDKEYTVVIKTQVQFRYGPARTRFYSIVVTCPSNANFSSVYDSAYYSRNDHCT